MNGYDFDKIRLVFFDIDGTFVDDRKRIAPDALEVMDALRARGVSLVPCTGRGFPGVTCLPGVVERSDFAICYDGALVFDLRGGGRHLLRTLELPPVVHRRVVGEALAASGAETPRSLVSFAETTMRLWNVPPEREGGLGVWGADPVRCDAAAMRADDRALLLLVYGDPAWVDAREAELTRDHAGELTLISYESDIMRQKGLILKHRETDKGEALAWLCAHAGVPVDATLALGDWLNDLGLLRRAGIGVAMKNAEPEVLDVADLVTEEDNNRFGAIEFLKRAFGLACATRPVPAPLDTPAPA